ncbi:MAG: tetratricopeptide repeat protein [Kofleriaceae bacterium]
MHGAVSAASFGEFEPLRVLGEGGTAIVYAARRNGIEIALKVLRDDIRLTDAERRRFLAEADQLAKISHPGVIHVLDAGVLPDGRPYLALPLLHGETLTARLARGPLPVATALDLFYAAADAITALHHAGLLHRDIKPENLFLDADQERLILLDFGIARDPDASASTSTQQGQVRGTPAYMAPERFFGVAATEASEVYELAATLHMMLAGTLPWLNGADLDARLDPQLSPAIAPAIAAVLRGALAVRAEVRPQSVAAFVTALRERDESEPASNATRTLPNAAAIARAASFPPPAATTKRMRRRTPGLVAAGAILVAGGVAFAVLRALAERDVADLVAPRRVVVVLSPRNVSGLAGDAWMATAIAERTRIGLAVGGSLVVPGEQALRELSLDVASPQGVAAPELLDQIRTRSHAALVMTGSYYAERDHTLRISFIAQEAVSGVVVASTSSTGKVEDLGQVVSRAVGELRTTLGDGPSAAERERALVDSLPSGGEASREYAEGLACARRFVGTCAKDHLQRAVALAPKSALAHDALADALHNAGNDAGAKTEATRALELGAGLPEEQHLLLEAHAAAYSFAWPRAVDAYQKLVAKWPDDLRYTMGLADAQANAAAPAAAFATLDHARVLSTDPRLDLLEAKVADKANDFVREGRAADRAILAADELGERGLGAYARLSKGWALVTLGKLDEAKTSLEEALRMFGAEGDRNGTARAVLDLGTMLEQKGDYDNARKMYEDALRLGRELGNQNAIATALLDLGQVLAESADPVSARARYEEALGIARTLGDVNLIEETLVNLGSVASKSGDIANARLAYSEALALARAHDHHRVICAVLANTSNIDEHVGEVKQAVAHALEAVAEARKTHEPALLNQALTALAEHESQAGDFKSALERFDEIERLQLDAKDNIGVISTRTTRVGVLADANRDAEAVDLARATLAMIDEKSDPDDFGWLHVELAKQELEAKHYDVARAHLDSVAGVLINAGDAELAAEVQITGAEILAARGQLARAEAQLVKARLDAVANGEDGVVREIDIVAVALRWIHTGDRAARARLGELVIEARAHGAGAVARQAEHLMNEHH